MHIAMLSPGWPVGYPNGIVTYVGNISEGLRSGGHVVSVLVRSGADPSTLPVAADLSTRILVAANRLVGRTIDSNWAIESMIADSVLRLHRRSPVDVLEMEETYGWAKRVQDLLPIPVVVKLHGPAFLSIPDEERGSEGSRLRILAERSALQHARYVISPSRAALEAARIHVEKDGDWGDVIPNPIKMDEDVPLWSQDIADSRTLLFVGRFDRLKGGDFAIRAFRRLLAVRPDLNLLFVGPDVGLRGEGEARCSVQEFVTRELAGSEISQFRYVGKVDSRQVAELRCRAAMVWVCSVWDNQPNTVLEAMYQGCPVVGVNAGGVSELIQHRVTGCLADRDIDSFCEQVLWVLDSPSEAKKLGASARKHVLAAHDARRLAQKTADFYAKVHRQHRAPSR